MGLSIASGVTCDYVRRNRIAGDNDLSEQIPELENAYPTTTEPVKGEVSAQAYDTASMKVEGEHGRIGRSNGAVDAACDEEDPEDCEFWNAKCKDIDCIYVGEHCRYQCAMAEVDKEPKPKVVAPNRGLRLLPSAA